MSASEASAPRSDTAGMRPLVASLDRVVRSLQGPGAQATHTVFGRWVDLVGASVAAHATPIKIERERLLVSVDEPGWATQLRYLEADLVAKLMAAGVTLVGIDFRVAR